MISSSLFYPPWNRSEYMLGREGRRKPHLELTDGKTEIKSPLRSRVRGDNEYIHCTGNHGFVRLVEHWELRYKRVVDLHWLGRPHGESDEFELLREGLSTVCESVTILFLRKTGYSKQVF